MDTVKNNGDLMSSFMLYEW